MKKMNALGKVLRQIQRLEASVRKKEDSQPRRELQGIIDKYRHLIVGGQAVNRYLPQPRFTSDTDILLAHQPFLRIKRWLQDNRIPFVEEGGSKILVDDLAIDVISVAAGAILKEVLKHEAGFPSASALAAMKWAAIVGPNRSLAQRHLDRGDLMSLVAHPQFRLRTFLSYFVAEFEEQRQHAKEIVTQIKQGNDIAI